jgi:hypothetical protein
VYVYTMKGKDTKKRTNIMIRPSVKEAAKKKAAKLAKKWNLGSVSFSQFIEIAIYEYAE